MGADIAVGSHPALSACPSAMAAPHAAYMACTDALKRAAAGPARRCVRVDASRNKAFRLALPDPAS